MPPKKQPKGSSISTGRGDTGTTDLLFGKRVPKDHPQVEACGTLDELTVAIGLARVSEIDPADGRFLLGVQRDLIGFMGEISCLPEDLLRYRKSNFTRLQSSDLKRLERRLGVLEGSVSPVKGWAIPGNSLASSHLEMARAIARRAERRLFTVQQEGFPLRPLLLRYLNRLSDLLWLMARKNEKTEAGRSRNED